MNEFDIDINGMYQEIKVYANNNAAGPTTADPVFYGPIKFQLKGTAATITGQRAPQYENPMPIVPEPAPAPAPSRLIRWEE